MFRSCLKKRRNRQVHRSRSIDLALKEQQKKVASEVKLLLLGAGESGKSTITKQMKIIHKAGFSHLEKMSYKSIVFSNVIASMTTLVEQAKDTFERDVLVANRELADKFRQGTVKTITKEIAQDIKKLWADPAIQFAFQQRTHFYIRDNAPYFFAEIDRLGSDSYSPNEQDILKCHAVTTGIHEMEFDVDCVHFRLIDVGGQRTERKKWIHCFDAVTAVLFCAAISEYDQVLVEDDETNRLQESLRVFKETCNSPWFKETAMILFLNKKDIFSEKIKRVPLTVCFPHYVGPQNFQSASEFIKEEFSAQNENPKRSIYTHFTCATDTNNITIVFNAVREIVIRQQLIRFNIM